MCHESMGIPRPSATCRASSVLPVPGSPLMRSGRSSATAQLTASTSGPDAIYPGVPLKRWKSTDSRMQCLLERYRRRLSACERPRKSLTLQALRRNRAAGADCEDAILLTIGTTREASHMVTADDSATLVSPLVPDVYASARLIGFAEATCAALMAEHLDGSETSVGSAFQFVHEAATPIGMIVRVSVTVIEI